MKDRLMKEVVQMKQRMHKRMKEGRYGCVGGWMDANIANNAPSAPHAHVHHDV